MKEYLPERLKKAMEDMEISRVALSEKTKIYQTSIGMYLDGRQIPRADNLYKMAKVLGVSMDWLYGNDN